MLRLRDDVFAAASASLNSRVGSEPSLSESLVPR